VSKPFHTRARELMLNPADKAAYLRLMLQGGRTEFQVICPDCGERFESYETNTLRHVRQCVALRSAAGDGRTE
jgi:hypothetical protein